MAKKPASDILDEIRSHEQNAGYTCKTCKLTGDVLKAVNDAKQQWKAGKLKQYSKQAILRWAQSKGYPYKDAALFAHFQHD